MLSLIGNMKEKGIHYIYILHCNNDTLYTGYTTDITRRYQEHLAGSAKCKYTRSFKPLRIAQCWKISNDKSTVMKVENLLKKLSRKQKQHLINCPKELESMFVDLDLVCEPFVTD